MKKISIALSALTAVSSISGVLAAASESGGPELDQEYEIAAIRRASEFLPDHLLRGPHHRVVDEVPFYGYMHHFTVQSDFGEFTIMGDAMLRKLVVELAAISEINKVSKGKAFAAAIAEGVVKKPLNLTRNLITHPVGTVSGVPKGFFMLLQSSVVGIQMAQERSEYLDGLAAASLSVSAYKRDYAGTLGIDVYSTNTVLQKELNRVAWAAAVGGLILTGTTMAVDQSVVNVVGALRTTDWIYEMLVEEPPARLAIRNRKVLAGLGVAEDLIDSFLSHPAYSPRHRTVIVQSLARLDGLAGMESVLGLLQRAESEEDAHFYQQSVEILRAYHENIASLSDLGVFLRAVYGVAEAGVIVVAVPVDHAIWDGITAYFVQSLKEQLALKREVSKVELWLTGTISAVAKEQLAELGVELVENVDERLGLVY